MKGLEIIINASLEMYTWYYMMLLSYYDSIDLIIMIIVVIAVICVSLRGGRRRIIYGLMDSKPLR